MYKWNKTQIMKRKKKNFKGKKSQGQKIEKM